MGYYTDDGLTALVDGANQVCLETYGGPNTPQYPRSRNGTAFDPWPEERQYPLPPY
jgi:hypothetical protein